MDRIIDEKKNVDIEYCFLKCKASYKTCIETEGNEYLQDEIEVPINELVLENESVNVIVYSDVYGEPIVDISIKLFSKKLNKYLGSYRCIESFDGYGLDDFLIFFD